VATIDPNRLVPVDEPVNIAMGRSRAWVQREEYEPRPMNWGDNLTLIGAMRADRWLTLARGASLRFLRRNRQSL
jgi:hypothetical protein